MKDKQVVGNYLCPKDCPHISELCLMGPCSIAIPKTTKEST